MKREFIKRTIIAGLLSGFILAGLTADADAIDTYWDVASGDWSTGSNWDSGEPTSTDYAYIDNGGTASITLDGEQAYSLSLGSSAGTSGYVSMTAGSLSTVDNGIGINGIGAFTQTGGTNTVTQTLSLGHQLTGSGTYILSGTGSLSANIEYIGLYGTGYFNQTGGTNQASNAVRVGWNYGSSGTYDLSGGSLSADNEHVGFLGTGTFTQSGGTNTLTDSLYLGDTSGGDGTYNLSDTGSLSAQGDEYIGNNGTGTFTQTGGTNAITNFLYVGTNSGSSGTYVLDGGSLEANIEYIGEEGTGEFYQSGGTNTANSIIIADKAGSTGTYNLSGGDLNPYDIQNYDTFNYSGGNLNGVIFRNYGSGSVNVSNGGTRTFNGNVDNYGTFHVTNTTVDFTGTFSNYGAYLSDPSEHYFDDILVSPSGYIVGEAGDQFFVRGSFLNYSMRNVQWDTVEAYLGFISGDDGLHDLYIPGLDVGQSTAGYADNFSWGTLELASGNSLSLFDGNLAFSGAALYVGEILGLLISDMTITNITGSSGLNIYYDDTLLGNTYLSGLTYDFTGGGKLIPLYGSSEPIPEPATLFLLGTGLVGLGLVRGRRRS